MTEHVNRTPSTNPAEMFRANMQRARLERGWSQGEFARRMVGQGFEDWHQATVSRIEKGTRPIKLDEAVAVAEMLELGLLDLMMPSEDAVSVAEAARWLRQYLETTAKLNEAVTEFEIVQQQIAQALRRARAKLAEGSLGEEATGHLRQFVEAVEEVPGETWVKAVEDVRKHQRERQES